MSDLKKEIFDVVVAGLKARYSEPEILNQIGSLLDEQDQMVTAYLELLANMAHLKHAGPFSSCPETVCYSIRGTLAESAVPYK